jgi:acetoin utilization deacetylase AcuC-like enzyme
MEDSMPDLPLNGLAVVTDPATERHRPGAEVWVGVRTPGTEVPERVAAIRDTVVARGADLLPPSDGDDSVLRSLHSPGLLAWLETAADRWAAGTYAADPGQDRVVPYVFPTEGMLGGLPVREVAATHALAGRYCYDTMTLVGPGTWEAAHRSAALARTAAELAAGGRAAYALCRPPGHHAAREAFGGSCYLNNAAVAAETMRRLGGGPVAVLDVDAHHGNGTQALFYDRDDVFYGSVHVDPGAGWFPHYLGFADETGRGAGRGWNLNVPLPEGAGDDAFLGAVDELVAQARRLGAQGLVVSLGVDAAADDPESPLRVTEPGYAAAGALLRALDVPTALVQEGGYHLPTLGPLVAATLGPFAGAVSPGGAR